MEKRLFLLDAYALIYRAHFALIRNPLINSKGMNVSAISGFTNTLHDLLKRETPTHMAVVFDKGSASREEEFEDYKANRQEMPEDISIAIPIIKEIVKGFRIPVVEEEGFEADDLIGTLALQAEEKGYDTYMVTPDKDFGQLVSENIFMYKPAYMGKPVEILGVEEILEKWQIDRTEQVIDILGLMGDAVDNIPGIPKVGPKTAMKLIGQYGSVEAVVEHGAEIKGKLGENVRNHAEQGLLSKKLATIITDAPVTFYADDFKVEDPDKKILGPLFADLEFRSIGKRILGDDYSVNVSSSAQQMDLFGGSSSNGSGEAAPVQGGKHIRNTDHEYLLIDQLDDLKKLVPEIEKQECIALHTEIDPKTETEFDFVGIGLSWEAHKGHFVLIPEQKEQAQDFIDVLKPILENEKVTKIGQNLKRDARNLRWQGINLSGDYHDTMIAHYLLEPERSHRLDYLSETWLGYTPLNSENIIGKGKKQLKFRQIKTDDLRDYSVEIADITLQIHLILAKSLAEKKLDKLFYDVELPLAKVLSDMEYAGVAVDMDYLAEHSRNMHQEILELQKKVHDLAGIEFNLDSPKQLGQVLFDHMGIEYKGKKTKTGQYSTSEEMLSKLAGEEEIVAHILEYREIVKLKSTYVDALPILVNPNSGRVHTTFGQTVAATGRLNSNQPNLQNIPIRTERGREIRKAFVPRDDKHVILSADYSQIELRIIASMSNDEAMIQAFNDEVDIHAITAARVYGVELEDVSADMRRNAKMVNFGIIYGISAFGLSQRLGIPRSEASALIKNYFSTYPAVKAYMDNQIEKAREFGYVETLMGRRRYLKDIHSRNYTVRGHAERNAINSPIQGSAADMIKVAMIRVDQAIRKAGLKSQMTLQVHDELVFDALRDEVDDLRELVINEMQAAMPLKVPVLVEAGIGENWLEAH
jgi:DNA polymerase-1